MTCQMTLEKYYKYLIVKQLFIRLILSKIDIITKKRVNMKGLKEYEL